MLLRVSIYLIFLFYYTCIGQIVLAPIQEQIANDPTKLKQKLNVKLKGTANESMIALKAKTPYEYIQLPSQWTLQESEAHSHWPVAKIGYYIDDDSYGAGVSTLLTMAFNSIRVAVDFSCPKFVRLRQKPIQGDWLHFTNPDRVRPCVHEPGINQGGEIKIVLGYDCLYPRDVLHTVLHGLGFRDEVTHPKRDLFVRVMWENIQPAFRFMFGIQSVDTSNDLLSEYDPMSIMHFHDRAFSVNGQPTIMPVLPGLKVEPSHELSHLDKVKIRRIFGNECKKLQIGNIVDICGSNNNIDFDGIYDNVNNGNNAGPCYNGGGDDQVVIQGHDVQLEDGGDANGAGVAIPGHDVQLEEDENSVVNHGDDDKLVVVGNDVQADKNDDEGVSDENSDVAIVAGHDAVQKISKFKSPKQKKLFSGVGSGGTGFDIPDDEAIVVGYNAGSKYRLNNFKKQKLKKLFGSVGSGTGFDIPSEEAIVVGYNARPERQ